MSYSSCPLQVAGTAAPPLAEPKQGPDKATIGRGIRYLEVVTLLENGMAQVADGLRDEIPAICSGKAIVLTKKILNSMAPRSHSQTMSTATASSSLYTDDASSAIEDTTIHLDEPAKMSPPAIMVGGPGQTERAILTSSSGNLFFKIDFGLLEKCVEN